MFAHLTSNQWIQLQEDQKSKEKNTPDQATEASIDDCDNEEKEDVQGEDLESSLWGFDDEDLLRSVNLEDKAWNNAFSSTVKVVLHNICHALEILSEKACDYTLCLQSLYCYKLHFIHASIQFWDCWILSLCMFN